jgi:plastocyanin
MRRLAIALALLALLVVPASQARAQAPAGGNGYGASVSAIDNVFTPKIVRIQPGETVEWTIDGRSPHTVQADDGSWDSGNLEPGAKFTHTFGEAGVYPFFCRYHGKPGAGMAGTAVVGDAPLPGGGVPGPDPRAASIDAHRGWRRRLPRLPPIGTCVRRLSQSSSWIRIRLNAFPFDSVLTTVT